jgi:hypothetical protein
MLAAGLCASMQLVGPLHYLLVAHYHCAAHGEMTHASGGHGRDHDHAHGVTDQRSAASVSSRTADHASHEHCAIATHERSQALVAEAGWTALVGAVCAVAQPAPRLPGFAADAPLDSAPKASPPIAG